MRERGRLALIPLARTAGILALAWIGFTAGAVSGQEPSPETDPREATELGAGQSDEAVGAAAAVWSSQQLQHLVESARASVVVVTTSTREGRTRGVGSGFVIQADGLIATNQHVIGEARAIHVELSDGREFEVEEVFASDARLDLALIRIPAKDLAPLALGDAEQLSPGQPVLALGNPVGLRHSVVAGIVSAVREIDGRPMIQLAIPVEPGNSGGPVLTGDGKVVGLLTTKSAVTANLGFAVTSNQLLPLLKHPNPVSIERWLALGALDPRQWQVVFGGRWRRRVGRISVEGWGESFGGRCLCLRPGRPDENPWELSVRVKLEDEAGAAGLVFGGDGGDRHYGFYPSGGRLRLTRFGGPDVNHWTILRDDPSSHYRPGDWNLLRVECAGEQVRCLVNDQLVYELAISDSFGPRQGLAKFRDTVAEFREFYAGPPRPQVREAPALAAELPESLPDPADRPAWAALVQRLNRPNGLAVESLARRAEQLRQEAGRVEQLARDLRHQAVLAELEKVVRQSPAPIDLARGALLISQLENPELDVPAYLAELDEMAQAVRGSLNEDADAETVRAALDRFLFNDQGFHGNRTDYYTRANSFLDRVIDDREGLPITLAVLYLELARRLDLDVVGIPLPGHFVVEWRRPDGTAQLIDVFDRGQPLERDDASRRVSAAAGRPPQPADFEPAGPQAILVRMLRNLLGVSQQERDLRGSLDYLDATLVIDPTQAQARMMRAVLRNETGNTAGAVEDIDWLLDHGAGEFDRGRLEELKAFLLRAVDR